MACHYPIGAAEAPRSIDTVDRIGAQWSTKMAKLLLVLMLAGGLALPVAAQKKEQDRVENAGTVMTEILKVPESIPKQLLRKADCVIVIPSVLKFAFVIGGSYGRGVMTCQTTSLRVPGERPQ
jgi:lipid-binding SYLF domain-containing protein